MKKPNILIVEDEILIAETIKDYLVEAGHSVTNIVISYEEAVEEFTLFKPDIILLDIRLYGYRSGIDFANYLNSLSIKTPVIYLTSQYDQRTLDLAIKSNPYGYITKPFQKETLITSVTSAYNLFQVNNKTLGEIHLFDGKFNHLVKFEELVYIKSEHVYLNVILKNETIIIRHALKDLMLKLPESIFIQCHRSFVVNRTYIKSWSLTQLTLVNDHIIPVSKNFKHLFNS
jgi:two-component system, LytTR family, response regulator LytT